MKAQGQQAVSKIIQIRGYFPKAGSIKAKEDYANEFKASILKLVAYLKTQSNQAITSELKAKLPNLQEELKKMRGQIQQLKLKQSKKIQQQNKSNVNAKKMDKEQQGIQQGISQAIVRQKPNVKWDDVGGLQQAKKVLQQAVILPIKFPQVFVGQRTPWKGILLYGPPGTGKTFLAKACATQMQGGTFFSVSASDLMSKYVGQSQKTLRALFQLARKQRPSIIFIDQIDSIAGQRSSQQNQVSRRVKTQFLIQMQGVGHDCKDVLVLGATNLPWAIDSAVRRRFQKRVYIPLPDIKGRLAIIKKAIGKNNINVTPEQLNNLAEVCQGYSGSDITNMINDALMSPVRKLDKCKIWIQVKDGGETKYSPWPQNSPKNPNSKYFEGNMNDLKAKGFKILLVTAYQDFLNALKTSKPSVSKNDLQKYIDWTKAFGVEG